MGNANVSINVMKITRGRKAFDATATKPVGADSCAATLREQMLGRPCQSASAAGSIAPLTALRLLAPPDQQDALN